VMRAAAAMKNAYRSSEKSDSRTGVSVGTVGDEPFRRTRTALPSVAMSATATDRLMPRRHRRIGLVQ
jgi:hypothetical protein